MTTLEILRAARALVARPGGWSNGRWENWTPSDTVPVCVSNACEQAAQGFSDAPRLLCRLLGADEWGVRAIFDWNDAPERTLDDVLALFDEAIAIEEAKAQEFSVEPIREVERV